MRDPEGSGQVAICLDARSISLVGDPEGSGQVAISFDARAIGLDADWLGVEYRSYKHEQDAELSGQVAGAKRSL